MPKGTKVADCVAKLMARGMAKPNAIRICQKSTGQSYKSGKKSKGKYGYKFKSRKKRR